MTRGVHAAALAVRFGLELALLTGAGALGWRLGERLGWGGWAWLLVVLAPLAVALLWGRLLSPKATVALPAAVRLAVETLLFVGVGAGLVATGVVVPAVVGVALWAADRAVLALTAPRP